jgi:hypothetical protein
VHGEHSLDFPNPRRDRLAGTGPNLAHRSTSKNHAWVMHTPFVVRAFLIYHFRGRQIRFFQIHGSHTKVSWIVSSTQPEALCRAELCGIMFSLVHPSQHCRTRQNPAK